jgi:carbamoyl-phosphate synthase large subunit
MTINVAVTGMGNPLGQNIMKALKLSSLPLKFFALDANPLSAGFLQAVPVLCPRASSPNFVEEFIVFLKRTNIRAVFFGTEAEPSILRPHRNKIEEEANTKLMMNDASVLSIADDKYLTAVHLAGSGLDHPMSAPAEDDAAVSALIRKAGFPLIVKPRKGSASRGLARVKSESELSSYRRPGFVVQECLLPDNAEFTVGVYRTGAGIPIATTVIHRDLDFGLTYRGIIEDRPEIADYANAVAASLNATGSCNIQLRYTKRGPVCFEVNPRFSSTTPIRAYFGVNEPELCIRELVLGETLKPVTARAGGVLREWNEIYLEQDELRLMQQRDLSTWKGA